MLVVTVATNINAQATGWNGVGFWKYAKPEDLVALIEASGPITEFRYRIDKDATTYTKKVIDLCYQYAAAGKRLDVMITAKANSADYNLATVDSFYARGVVPFIELGNERYAGQFKHTFSTYIGEYQTTIDKIKEKYPNTVFVLNVMPRPEGSTIPGPKKGSLEWNSEAYIYCVANNARISWHSYINEKDAAFLKTVPSQLVYNPTSPSTKLLFYDTLATLKPSLASQTIAYLRANFPNIKVHFTEIGIVPSDDESLDNADIGTSQIRNTVAYSGIIYDVLHELMAYEHTASVDIHAGIALNGLIAPPSKYDVSLTNVKKMEYFAFELFNETGVVEELPTESISLGVGYHVYRFGYGSGAPNFTIPKGTQLITNCRYVGGKSWETSGGSGYMGKGTTKIPAYTGANYSTGVPYDGWGYIEYVVEVVDVPGCMDAKATNYNPDATVDDGSCTYPPPAECLKKRWLFPSLGCKPSKKVCDC